MDATGGEIKRTRPRGRPRLEGADDAIHAAALEVVAEVGYQAATLETIATRAEVGTATIYRRYRTKRELFARALELETQNFAAPQTGDVAEDLAIMIHELAAGIHSRPLGRLLAAVALAEPELLELGWCALAQPRRAIISEVLIAAIAAGQVRADLDIELFLDIVGAVPLWGQLVHPDTEFTRESARAVADLLLVGARV